MCVSCLVTDVLNQSYKMKTYSAKTHAITAPLSHSLGLTSQPLPPLGLSPTVLASGPAAEYHSDSAESLMEVPAQGGSPHTMGYADPGESPDRSHGNYGYSSDIRDGLNGYHNPYYGNNGGHVDHKLPRQQDSRHMHVPPIDLSSFHSSDSENNNNDYQRSKVKKKTRVKVKSRGRVKNDVVVS